MVPRLDQLTWCLLAVFAFSAIYGDLRHRVIPNRLIITGLALAWAAQLFSPPGAGLFSFQLPGGLGLAATGLATVLGLLIGMVLWKLRFFAAGDAKLLTVMAALLGPSALLPLLLATAVCGGLLVPVHLLMRSALASRALPSWFSTDRRLPYSIAIVAGATLVAAMASTGAASNVMRVPA
jgi:prepilin peptidase CpaA